MRSLVLFLAQGFAVGRIRMAPGTFGSAVGFGWFLLLLVPGNPWIFLWGSAAGVALSVWACGKAERFLGRPDPPSVVLDEIVALPLCFLSWVAWFGWKQGHLPAPAYFLSGAPALGALGVFVAFRFFDIAKPWPVDNLQRLPGGWGVTLDDVMAAVYANAAGLACGAGFVR
jgi:phosphatidylglycerophosphatase A